MAEIIYFGTDGCSGHYPIGIDKTLTHAEYKMWNECDNETWINNIRKNPGRHLIKHHGEVYTNYGVPFSVDDDRVGSHTELFWKGIHEINNPQSPPSYHSRVGISFCNETIYLKPN